MWNSVQLTSLSSHHNHDFIHSHTNTFFILQSLTSHPQLPHKSHFQSTQHTHSPSTISSIITLKSFIIPSMSCIVSLCVLTTSLHPSSHQIKHFLHLIIKPSTSFQSSHISCPKHNSFNPTHFNNHSLILSSRQHNNHHSHNPSLCFFILLSSNTHSSISFHQSFFQ